MNPYIYSFVGQFRATAPQFDPRRPKLKAARFKVIDEELLEHGMTPAPPTAPPIAPFAKAAATHATLHPGKPSWTFPDPDCPSGYAIFYEGGGRKCTPPEFKGAPDAPLPGRRPELQQAPRRPQLRTPPAKTFTQRDGAMRAAAAASSFRLMGLPPIWLP